MSIKANIHDAKTNLSRLIERALTGEEVVIAKAGKPMVKLVPVEDAGSKAGLSALIGSMRGKIWVSDDFDDPDPAFEALFYGEDDEPRAPLKGVAED